MKIMLDTNICIYLFKQRPQFVLGRLRSVSVVARCNHRGFAFRPAADCKYLPANLRAVWRTGRRGHLWQGRFFVEPRILPECLDGPQIRRPLSFKAYGLL